MLGSSLASTRQPPRGMTPWERTRTGNPHPPMSLKASWSPQPKPGPTKGPRLGARPELTLRTKRKGGGGLWGTGGLGGSPGEGGSLGPQEGFVLQTLLDYSEKRAGLLPSWDALPPLPLGAPPHCGPVGGCLTLGCILKYLLVSKFFFSLSE